MVRLEAFVDDKKVAKVLHALDGLVIQMTVLPVRNAISKKGKVVAAGDPTTGPQIMHLAIKQAVKAGRNTFDTKDALALAQTYGVSRAAVNSAINAAKDQGVLRQSKTRGTYVISNNGSK